MAVPTRKIPTSIDGLPVPSVLSPDAKLVGEQTMPEDNQRHSCGVPLPLLIQTLQAAIAQSGGSGTWSQTFANPCTVWTLHHNLGFYPEILVLDSAGSRIDGDEFYPDLNTVRIEFSAPFAGTAYLR